MSELTKLLEQPLLFEPSAEEEVALFFPPEILAKRYTTAQVQNLELKRKAIEMLLGFGCPVRRIKEELHVGQETILTIAKQSAEKVSAFTQEFSEHLLRLGTGWLAMAAVKAPQASFDELSRGANVALTHARELRGMGLLPEKESVNGDLDRVEAARQLRAIMEADLAKQLAAGDGEGKNKPAEASVPVVKEGRSEAATPQPVVSCGVKTDGEPDITLADQPETKTLPA